MLVNFRQIGQKCEMDAASFDAMNPKTMDFQMNDKITIKSEGKVIMKQ